MSFTSLAPALKNNSLKARISILAKLPWYRLPLFGQS